MYHGWTHCRRPAAESISARTVKARACEALTGPTELEEPADDGMVIAVPRTMRNGR